MTFQTPKPVALGMDYNLAWDGVEVYGYTEQQMQEVLAERDALAKDAARIDWLESSKEMHGFCHIGYGEYRHYAFQMKGYANVRDTIDAAMKGQTP